MELYKFIDEHNVQKWDKKYVILDGKQISYPSEDVLRQAGIKPLVEDEIPEYDVETQYPSSYYEELEDSIVQHWQIEEIPPIEEVIIDEQIISD